MCFFMCVCACVCECLCFVCLCVFVCAALLQGEGLEFTDPQRIRSVLREQDPPLLPLSIHPKRLLVPPAVPIRPVFGPAVGNPSSLLCCLNRRCALSLCLCSIHSLLSPPFLFAFLCQTLLSSTYCPPAGQGRRKRDSSRFNVNTSISMVTASGCVKSVPA